MSSDNVSRILDGCETKARKDNPELLHLHSHLFRRTRAMHLYQAGVPLPTISEWLGHSNIETTRFYAKVTEEMEREALHKLSCFTMPIASMPVFRISFIIGLVVNHVSIRT